MSENVSKAKEIFMRYSGSHFQMERGGEFSNYQNYGISNEQELEWIKEFADTLIKELDSMKIINSVFIKICAIIKQYKLTEFFRMVFDWAKSNSEALDTFTNLRIAEEILGIVDVYKESESKQIGVIREAKEYTHKILLNISKRPITINPIYKEIDYLQGCLDDVSIQKRIEAALRKFNN